ncbi:MAG: alanine--tRNA ligase [Bacteroidales bacterium]|nr:alanine--tRNA ligase [Bacteroidales bacterium]
MKSIEIRQQFLDFFQEKNHQIVPSAPMVVKDDPTLMFTNAGMNQFKDMFLGNKPIKFPRIADTQKCLRVSGKHNDLEEVGHDTYHHTMFEMLGNWSFGDYFKEEAIEWGWELLTKVFGVDKSRLYITIFGGDQADLMPADVEAEKLWQKWISPDRIIHGSKKDNFWEMGDVGPCGPCSEIHVDLRPDDQRKLVDGKALVNTDNPLVIEIWNLVFIQFNRKADGSLEALPNKHVDTGMGFERLAMVLQGKQSNYDTDVFQPLLQAIATLSAQPYGVDRQKDVAMRVIADHLRAVAFAIADGQMPSNNKAGYVIRRILRRAVRYGYTFLGFEKPFIHNLVPVLVNQMGDYFPELKRNQDLIVNVISEEENSFLRTLATGLTLLQKIIDDVKAGGYKTVKGSEAFELYDTYGFPLDLTELICRENGLIVSRREFDEEMAKQKERSRADANVETSDMIVVREDDREEFVGYDHLTTTVEITRYRIVKTKGKELVHLVLNITPFYAESGGQIGDRGILKSADGEVIKVLDAFIENNLIIHLCDKMPSNIHGKFKAIVDEKLRRLTANNHTATHLLHHALRKVLGSHVEQKGSLVTPEYLRFDFSHFKKMEAEELKAVALEVNRMIRENHQQELFKDIPIDEAKELGAMSLFGEKYGDLVRAVRFGNSIELCGGTHAQSTGQIGLFVIRHETSIAAGVRRIEAITADAAEAFFYEQHETLSELKTLLKNANDLPKAVQNLLDQNRDLQKDLDAAGQKIVNGLIDGLKAKAKNVDGIDVISQRLDLTSDNAKNLVFRLSRELNNTLIVVGLVQNNKPMLMVTLTEDLAKSGRLNAGAVVRELAKEINGGGGGQPHFATAGGSNAEGLDKALSRAECMI